MKAQKTIAGFVLLSFIALLAYIQYANNLKGGHSFSQSIEDQQMWALTFTALLGLLGMFSMVRAVVTEKEKRTRRFLTVFISALAFVLAVGGFAGRMATTKNADLAHTADGQQAASMRQQAADIRRIASASIPGLEAKANDMTASAGTRNAAREQLAAAQSNLERAGKLEQDAAQITRTSAVSSDEIFAGFIGIFFGLIQICIELGFAVCCHYFALLFCGQIRNLFNNLREHAADTNAVQNAAKEAAEIAAKKPQKPAHNSRDEMTVFEWVRDIKQAAKSNPEKFISSRGLIKRQAVRDMDGGNSAVAVRAFKLVNQQLRKAA